MVLQAPFPWFGGKRLVAPEVWSRLGDVGNYVEPFFGSGAVLLGRPSVPKTETINDKDGYVANFWRSIKYDPEKTAEYADNPVNENDLHARHIWLVQQKIDFVAKLEGDPEFYDPKIAGWWVWGICAWIGGGFCSGKGPWGVDENNQLVHLGDKGQGVNRKCIHLGNSGRGVNRKNMTLVDWFDKLANRLRGVRVASGDWSRVCGRSVTHNHGLTGVFLDPPYADTANRADDLYRVDDLQVAHRVREWAIENGDNKKMRIALCGYEGEHEMPNTWIKWQWNAGSGYGGQAKKQTGNGKRERIWFSPHCLGSKQQKLF